MHANVSHRALAVACSLWLVGPVFAQGLPGGQGPGIPIKGNPASSGANSDIVSIGSVVFAEFTCAGNAVDVAATIQAWVTANAGHRLMLPAGACGVSASISVPASTLLGGQGQGVTTLDASALGKPGMGPVVSLVGNYASLKDLTIHAFGPVTTVAVAMNNSQTTMQVASSTGYPSTFPFSVTINHEAVNSADETVTVTGIAGTTWTIVRSGSPTAHAVGAEVTGTRYDDGVYIQGAGATKNVVSNVEVYGAGSNGIETAGDHSTISNDNVHDNGANGIYLYGLLANPVAYGLVIANEVDNNSLNSHVANVAAGSPGWDGIDADPNAIHTLVENNHVIGNDIIVFDSNAAPSNLVYDFRAVGNTIVNSQGGCLTASGPVANVDFVGNTCVNTLAKASLFTEGPVKYVHYATNSVYGSVEQCAHLDQLTGVPNAGIPDSVTYDGNICVNTISGGVEGSASSAVYIGGGATNTVVSGFKFYGTVGYYSIDTSTAAASTTITGNYPLVAGATSYINNVNTQTFLNQPGGGVNTLVNGVAPAGVVNNALSNTFVWGQNAAANNSSCWAVGFSSLCSGNFGFAWGSNSGTWSRNGYWAFASGNFSVAGDAETGTGVLRSSATCSGGTVTLRATSTGAAAAAANLIQVANGNVQGYNVTALLSDDATGDYVVYTLVGGGASQTGGTYALASTNQPALTKGGGTATGGGWAAPTLTADNTNKGLNFSWTNAACVNTHAYSAVVRVDPVDH